MKLTLLEHPRKSASERSNDIANTTLSSCLNSGYLAAVAKQEGHEASIIEGYMRHMSYDAIEEEIRKQDPDFLGIHLVYNWDAHQELFDFLKQIKKDLPNLRIFAFGYYPTFAADEVLNRCKAIDYIFYGETEETLRDLLKRPDDPEMIQGLAIRDDFSKGGIRKSSGKIVEDLDALPFPVRSDSSIPFGQANILASRGCYGNCTFCYINPYYGIKNREGTPVGRWRARSIENILAEIDQIIEENHVRYFYFTDPNFYGPGKKGLERVKELALELEKRDIKFGIEARANDIEDESIKLLKNAGLCDILVGLESGRDESLKRLNKHTSVSDNEKALQILRDNGIEPAVGFIMFEPDSSLEDLRTNFEFLKRNALLDRLDRTINVLYHHQIILKGSSSYQMMRAANKLVISDHSDYEAMTVYENPKTATLAEAMRLITNHFFEFINQNWYAYAENDQSMKKIFDEGNALLVDCFEEGLSSLEKGEYDVHFPERIILKIDRLIGATR